MKIYEALNLVMRDVQGVRKGERNTMPGGGFMFRGIDAVTNAVGPALREHGVIVVPEVLDAEYSTIHVGQKQTVMSRVVLRVRFTWYGPEGDSIASVVQSESMDSGDKATAKAHSVAFRTAMIQTLALPTDEPDPDSTVYERSPGGVAAAAAASVDLDGLRKRIAGAEYADLGALWREAAGLGVLDTVRADFDARRAAAPVGGGPDV